MKIAFYASKKDREYRISEMFKIGAEAHDHICEILDTATYRGFDPESDVAVVIGVKGISRQCIDDYVSSGRQYVYLDKGYFRFRDHGLRRSLRKSGELTSPHYKLSVNGFQPLDYLMKMQKTTERFESIFSHYHLDVTPMRRDGAGEDISILGSSGKYTEFHGLGDANEYWRSVVASLHQRTNRKIIYRPKGSWKFSEPIKGTFYSRPPRTLSDDLSNAWVSITNGSNASVESILLGIPVISLGPSIASPVSSLTIDDVENPRIPTETEVIQWLSNVSHCQFTKEEMSSGMAWEELSKWLR